ncbi:TetR/AcrR family transcriptional regulator [Corynebacterium glyciniphilum]|uniref:TetR/AcrR family transcriptional regulator n=1 Tax=Corynebacterium glyciniphilum TaxID=1404244 RepID=UPI003DA0B869
MPAKKAQATQGTRRGPTTPMTMTRAANQRADAQRNRAKILAGAITATRKNPDASVADIAAEAGVGRMTLYGHFQKRAELIDAALADSLEQAEEVLSAVPLDGDPVEAFQRLITSSWPLLDQSRALLAAAQKELPAARIREMHEKAEARMRGLLERGQDEGAFRADLPVSWLLTTAHVVMNGAAEEVRTGRLDADDAPRFINSILLSAFTNATWPGRAQ